MQPNFRRLRAVAAVAQHGTIARAASSLHRSSPVVTRAVIEAEEEMGFPLFDRSRQGFRLTDKGHIVVARIRAALKHLTDAETEIASRGFFAQNVSLRQLEAVISIAQHHTETRAAEALALSQPAVTRALGDLERMIAQQLFYRTARGMISTLRGEQIVRRAKLALAEIELIEGDLRALDGQLEGRVVVGALPLASTLFVPKAIHLTLERFPDIRIKVQEGTYETFLSDLRCGELDVIVGALRPHELNPDVNQEALFTDTLAVIARASHPLASRASVTLKQLIKEKWVLPREGTPARARFNDIFKYTGATFPRSVVEAGSLVTVRGLLMEGDRVSVASPHQFHFEITSGSLVILRAELEDTARTIGISTRSDALPNPSVDAFTSALREACAALKVSTNGKR